MAMIRRKPRTPTTRFQTFLDHKEITKKKPEKSLVSGIKRGSGRNAYGRITVRHRGGGAARKYRLIDFARSERDILGKVIAIEYDPNRNVYIALVSYVNGAKKYILMPEGLRVGDTVFAGLATEAKLGHADRKS